MKLSVEDQDVSCDGCGSALVLDRLQSDRSGQTLQTERTSIRKYVHSKINHDNSLSKSSITIIRVMSMITGSALDDREQS